MMLSIFICTYNPNQVYLKRVVDSIMNQSFDKNNWEFYIVDNNSKNSVAEIDFVKELGIPVLFEKKPGLTSARHCALNSAKGDVLVFVDDDNVLDKDYLFWVNKAFADTNIGILAGAIYPEYVVTPEPWFLQYERMLAIRRIEGDDIIFNTSTMENEYFPIGAGMSIRKELISDYYINHINDSTLIEGRKGAELSSGEDIDLDFYALYKGYKIGYFPRMKITHIIPQKRVDINYLVKLSVSSLKSSYQVNQKWAPVFKHNVYEAFNLKIKTILLKAIVNKLGGVLSRDRYMKANFFWALYKLKRNK